MGTVSQRPTRLHALVRAADRISFLYLERCVVNRESNAITATNEKGTVHIPAATVGVLLLGPGTTVTHQAILLLSDSGATVVWIGENGVRYYAHGVPLARSSKLLQAQAEAVSNRKRRLGVARAMYALRFPGEDVAGLTMQQLRGREGSRVRRVYRENSARTGVEWDKRLYDPEDWGAGDIVNQALSAANACLYGVVHSVVVALGCSPGLGFIHTGQHRSFVYDIADLYKAELTIPIAFDLVADGAVDIGTEARHRVRDALHDRKLLSRCAADIRTLLLPEEPIDDDLDDLGEDDVLIWDERLGAVVGGVSYGEDA